MDVADVVTGVRGNSVRVAAFLSVERGWTGDLAVRSVVAVARRVTGPGPRAFQDHAGIGLRIQQIEATRGARTARSATRYRRPRGRGAGGTGSDQPVRRTGLIRRPCAARARPEEPAWTAPLGAVLPARPRRAARLAGAAGASAGLCSPVTVASRDESFGSGMGASCRNDGAGAAEPRRRPDLVQVPAGWLGQERRGGMPGRTCRAGRPSLQAHGRNDRSVPTGRATGFPGYRRRV